MEHNAVIDGCLEAIRRTESVATLMQELGDPESRRAVGEHLRHCIDYFLCFLVGLETGLVDYETSESNGMLERDPSMVRKALDSLRGQLKKISEEELQDPIQTRQSASPNHPPVTVESTLERELIFLSGHTLHHLALVTLIGRNLGLTIPENLGLEYSPAAQ